MEAEQQGRDLLNVMRKSTNFGGPKKSMIHKSNAFKAMQSQVFTNNSQVLKVIIIFLRDLPFRRRKSRAWAR